MNRRGVHAVKREAPEMAEPEADNQVDCNRVVISTFIAEIVRARIGRAEAQAKAYIEAGEPHGPCGLGRWLSERRRLYN